ncbi:hypothetical protein ElyMa_003248600 [Elysia marginata]|uniref:Uncharacterized protein n=1 Tax=Elysia marginata TaxID=1093978 RepID=A0AAV4JB51_9GAST|nr:hypothetical protein ElyMa_003248600 [Elysia marginata]
MLGSRAYATSKGLVERMPQRPACDHRMVNAVRLTAGRCYRMGQRRLICSTSTLRQVVPGRWKERETQQPYSFRRMSGCHDEGHLTRTANVDLNGLTVERQTDSEIGRSKRLRLCCLFYSTHRILSLHNGFLK